WTVFTNITQLFIMVPVLLGLKGNLEMNLASRMSTAANLGDLDVPRSQRLLVWGNLALLQLQALSVSCLAGLLSVIMGLVTSGNGHAFSYHRSMLVITSAMICAALSSALLGLCMCVLCIVCRRRGINPDNVATPIAASFGDLITLAVLAITSHLLYPMQDTPLPTVLFVIMVCSLPAWFWLIRKNELVRDTMLDGWVPILLAMAISSLAGLVLERYIDRYAGMAVLVPVLNGVSGNLCCVFASRISTALHARRSENYWTIGIVLWLLNLPVQWPFLGVVYAFRLGHGSVTVGMFLLYTLASMLLVSCRCVAALLVASHWIVLALWRRSLDPDNYALPYITAIGDVAGTSLLVLVFFILYGSSTSTAT
ncbi:putative solute carrier family 41 member 1, partial [Dimargaris cristalligena]